MDFQTISQHDARNDTREVKCAMCGRAAKPFPVTTKKSVFMYYRCDHCGFISIASRHQLTAADEKARYLLHKNDASNAGYLDFLRDFLKSALLPYTKPGSLVLDFGSGPSPQLATMAAALGYRCDIYDPIFAKTRSWRRRDYDAILLHEVVEHLRRPSEALSRLAARVRTGGVLAIRTRFLPGSAKDFSSWWYRMDPTHVSFYTPACLSGFFSIKGYSPVSLQEPDIIIFRNEGIRSRTQIDD